ncbi:MAG: hypothetical protein ACRDKT_06720 [Actinomycetota bacterium]
MPNQFRPARVFGFLLAFALMFAWIVWLINTVGVQGGDTGFEDPSVWDQHRTAAVITVVFVIVADVIATWLAFRHARMTKEEDAAEDVARAARLKEAGIDPKALSTNPVDRFVAGSAAKGGTR